ncbi:MAG: GtrA family protein [Bacteroidales bacterium]|nr:GtrA family protein [Bacteroidales bacterium]
MQVRKLWDEICQSQATLFQLVRYGLVGGIAWAVDFGLLAAFTELGGLHYTLSAALSFLAGLVVNYLLSNLIVFKEHRVESRWAEFAIFAAIGGVGLLLNEGIMYACTEWMGLHYMLSKIAATALVFFWNFFARKFALFQTNQKRPRE